MGHPKHLIIICTLAALFCAAAVAEEVTKVGRIGNQNNYEPLSLDPPPVVIEGVKVQDVLALFRSKKYTDIKDLFFCPLSGTYLSYGIGSDHTGVTHIESYTGKDDFVKLSFQVSGFTESKPGQQPENMAETIKIIAEEAQVACADNGEKAQLAELLEDKMTKVVYATEGKTMPNGAIYNEDFFVFDRLHIHIKNYNRRELAETRVEIAGARIKTWTDKAGKFKIDASYLVHDSKHVKLVKKDGSEITVPLAKLSGEDVAWLAKVQDYETRGRPVEEDTPKGVAAQTGDKKAKAQWANASYNTTLRHIKGKEWSEFDNKTGQVHLKYRETARTKDSLELVCPERKQKLRILSDKMELNKNGKWVWVASGRWDGPMPK